MHPVVSIVPVGTATARYIQALAAGRDDWYTALLMAETWRDTPQVKATLELRGKAAVASASTTDATWAAPLASYGIAQEAIGILRGLSIFGALEGKMQRVPLHVKVPVETGAGITGGWVGEGSAIVVQKTAYATSTEENYKYGVIVPFSEELATTSDPAAVPTITRAVLGGLAKAMDTQLLTPTITAVAGTNPASILAGSTEITTTGTTAAQIAADLAGMIAAVTTPGPYVWILKPKTAARIALTLGSQAAGLPNSLFGIQAVVSANSPAQIALIDPSAIIFSDSGGFDLDVSRNALLELNDAPANPTVAGTIMHSLYQRNDVAIKAMRALAWLNLSPTTSASFMTVSW